MDSHDKDKSVISKEIVISSEKYEKPLDHQRSFAELKDFKPRFETQATNEYESNEH